MPTKYENGIMIPFHILYLKTCFHFIFCLYPYTIMKHYFVYEISNEITQSCFCCIFVSFWKIQLNLISHTQSKIESWLRFHILHAKSCFCYIFVLQQTQWKCNYRYKLFYFIFCTWNYIFFVYLLGCRWRSIERVW